MQARKNGPLSPAAPPRMELLRSTRVWTWGLLLAGIALAIAHALTKLPHGDEGDLASAAASLLDRGRIAFPMSYGYGASVRQEYLLAPPFYPASLAAWFAAFGRSLEAYRLFHILWFVLLVASWMQLVRAATVTRVALPIAAGLLALNYDLINLGVSRYDIVCAALNAAAMASLAIWRIRRFALAVFASNCCLALAALTHPYAVFGLVGCLAIFLANGDWRRIRVQHALLALAPYAVAFGVWALVINGNWNILLQQIAMQAQMRKLDFDSPVRVFMADFVVRWWQLFAGWRDGVPAIMRAKTLFLLLWACMPFLVFRRVPGDTFALRIAIVLYCLVTLLAIPLTDNSHFQIYNLHVIVGFTALTAIVLADLWEYAPRLRLPLLAVLVAICLFGFVGIGLRVSKRDLQHEYVPAHALLTRGLVDGDIVIAPAEMGFGLGFEKHVRADPALTSVGSDEMPRFIVESKEFGRSAPYAVACGVGALVQETTTYEELPLHTPSHHYRVLSRVFSADSSAIGGRGIVNISRCR